MQHSLNGVTFIVQIDLPDVIVTRQIQRSRSIGVTSVWSTGTRPYVFGRYARELTLLFVFMRVTGTSVIL